MNPRRRTYFLAAASFALMTTLAACGQKQHWDLDNVSAVLPNLKFDLTSDTGQKVTAADYAGKVVILYFGYTHCPDVCPLTMSHLAEAVKELGPQGKDVQILMVSVDPARDTLPILRAYTQAFSPQAIGLTGTPQEIQEVTKRYHVAYQLGKKDKYGNYVVDHSAAIYIFSKDGRGTLIGSDLTPVPSIVHDVKQLLAD
jgi:protein SCO1/2